MPGKIYCGKSSFSTVLRFKDSNQLQVFTRKGIENGHDSDSERNSRSRTTNTFTTPVLNPGMAWPNGLSPIYRFLFPTKRISSRVSNGVQREVKDPDLSPRFQAVPFR